MDSSQRHALAKRRTRNILRRHGIATARTLEQKISDAGPLPQRVDPHILTDARNEMLKTKDIAVRYDRAQVPWYFLAVTPANIVKERFALLEPLHRQTIQHDFTKRVGQALEIAVLKALAAQNKLTFLGNFPNLDEHDDSQLYAKEEPPSSISGNVLPSGKLDFILFSPTASAGIEVKNTRSWIYPHSQMIRDLLLKCCHLHVVPVLIARRIPYVTFSVLNPCGVIVHQTYNQLYPAADRRLAEQVKDKRLLGYHDIRLGNEPDARLRKFFNTNLPKLLKNAPQRFESHRDLLFAYGSGDMAYKEFAARVKRRQRGEPEDLPPIDEP